MSAATQPQTRTKREPESQALKAARRMMIDRGYVVLQCYAPVGSEPQIGRYARKFGNQVIGRGLSLILESVTDRADWDAQYEALLPYGGLEENPATGHPRERFYRCQLARVAEVPCA